MIASLGMYDMPALQPANDRFWQAIRARLGHGPEQLTRDRDLWEIWQAPDLLLAQTCGLPYRSRLHDRVALVGTPDYGLPDCPPGYYRSVLVVRAGDRRATLRDFAGARLACNEGLSQSGWAAPMAHLAGNNARPGAIVFTGAHAASARAVATGQADIAGIDALTWALLLRHDPVTRDLRVIAQTEPTPGLPYITAQTQDAVRLADQVAAAIGDLNAGDKHTLHIRGLVAIPASDYLSLPPAPPAPDAG
ncbi:phosphate/phosphite/phosphonate ABC transporter substrate-binding protein [Seohaeicola saemankumensis]|nr:PhnD/SsuA/transferrin family substrate-binding protein [Seohaeicola saemankumensis]MCA0870023.1 phosphate/phosphite/phosphonate ABC transporter substrate-binding protein [Seohaeicola saemankumensis]